jgi:DNA-binding NtrC family response regulator
LVAAQVEPVPARVVIVDDSADSREVFHTLLERRGVASLEVSGAREGLELVRRHQPEVVILDLDAGGAQDEHLQEEFEAATRASSTALVVLGKARRYQKALPYGQVIAKPYHYEPLIRTIERLLVR